MGGGAMGTNPDDLSEENVNMCDPLRVFYTGTA